MKWRVAAVSLVIGLLAVPVAGFAADTPGTVPLRDPRITESSSLVDLGSSWVTANDSGDSARVFLVSPTTGRTIGITYFHTSVLDVEALAPAGRDTVWVGDIGDNDGKRKTISVFRVRVGTGRLDVIAKRYRLVYPKGRPNAESLFADRQGRLYVITKSIAGGVVYRAPTTLSSAHANRLQAVGHVIEYATDAALTRDGKHVIVRGPELAGVYTFPRFQRVASFRLPPQPQGEGISVGPTGLVRVSSEGMHTAIRQVTLPASVAARLSPPTPAAPPPSASASPSPSPTASPSTSASPSPSPATSTSAAPGAPSGNSPRRGFGALDSPWLMWTFPGVVALGALGIGLGLRRRAE